MNDRPAAEQAHPVDLYVGARLRIRRKMMGLSQTQVADALGITFQQIQKYERGANRISASKLYDAAKLLQAPVSYFFEGLNETDGGVDDGFAQRMTEFVSTPEGLELASLFPASPTVAFAGGWWTWSAPWWMTTRRRADAPRGLKRPHKAPLIAGPFALWRTRESEERRYRPCVILRCSRAFGRPERGGRAPSS